MGSREKMIISLLRKSETVLGLDSGDAPSAKDQLLIT